MISKKILLCIWMSLALSSLSFAVTDQEELGQTIQIHTRLCGIVGQARWLLIVRDVDEGVVMPYLFDFVTGDNFWLIFTRSRNYLITVSRLRFSPYRHDCSAETINFCHLESCGRIMRGESMIITLQGKLTPYTDTYSCHVTRYPDTFFTIVKPAKEEPCQPVCT